MATLQSSPWNSLAARATWWRFHTGMTHKEDGQRGIKRRVRVRV